MTQQELIKRLEISCLGLDRIDPLRLLVDDVIEALAQQEQDHIPDARKMVTEQEPVAWGNFKEDGTLVGLSQHPEDQANWTNRKPLYTTPPQRTWVGLTESDRRLINFEWQDGNGTATEIIDLVEAKLKEKNT
jgi:hypothetical protein